jgi:hypothetical protein
VSKTLPSNAFSFRSRNKGPSANADHFDFSQPHKFPERAGGDANTLAKVLYSERQWSAVHLEPLCVENAQKSADALLQRRARPRVGRKL